MNIKPKIPHPPTHRWEEENRIKEMEGEKGRVALTLIG